MQTLPPPGKAGSGSPTQLRSVSNQSRFDLRSMRLWLERCCDELIVHLRTQMAFCAQSIQSDNVQSVPNDEAVFQPPRNRGLGPQPLPGGSRDPLGSFDSRTLIR
jgi:hypothetical protein